MRQEHTENENKEQNPQEIYVGRAGYARMLSEIRQSLYDQIPEAKGSIEIFDHLANPDQEIARIAQSFDISIKKLQEVMGYDSYDEFRDDLGGKMLSAKLEDGRYIAIPAAWDPDKLLENPDNMTFDEVKTFARIIIHETLHALDPRVQENGGEYFGNSGWVIAGRANSKSTEMFADVGAQDLLLKNGDAPNKTFELMVGYDANANFRNNPRYDNGAFMQQLIDEYPSGKGISNFYIDGWKDTIEKIENMRSSGNPEISIAESARSYPQTFTFKEIKNRILDNLEIRLAPIKEDLATNEGIENLRDEIEYWIDNMDFRGFKSGEYDDKLSEPKKAMFNAIYDAKLELANWLEENKDLFPDAARVAAATRYMLGIEDSYRSVAAPPTNELTTDMLMARNWLRFKETGDGIFEQTADEYGDMTDLIQRNLRKETGASIDFGSHSRNYIIKQLFEEHPKLVEAIADGIPLKDLVVYDSGQTNRSSDDIYSISPNFDEVIANHAKTQASNPTMEAEPSLQPAIKP